MWLDNLKEAKARTNMTCSQLAELELAKLQLLHKEEFLALHDYYRAKL